MRQYHAEDFLSNKVDSVNIAIEKKISLLYDRCILRKHDPRIPKIRAALTKCSSEYEVTTALHDVVLGNKSIDTFLRQKGLM